MPIFERRSPMSLLSSRVPMSSPSMLTFPPVTSMSRVMQRTSVDFPEPDSPMMTSVSPRAMSMETLRTAAMYPALRMSSKVGVPVNEER